jgi:hypothetical protein
VKRRVSHEVESYWPGAGDGVAIVTLVTIVVSVTAGILCQTRHQTDALQQINVSMTEADCGTAVRAHTADRLALQPRRQVAGRLRFADDICSLEDWICRHLRSGSTSIIVCQTTMLANSDNLCLANPESGNDAGAYFLSTARRNPSWKSRIRGRVNKAGQKKSEVMASSRSTLIMMCCREIASALRAQAVPQVLPGKSHGPRHARRRQSRWGGNKDIRCHW